MKEEETELNQTEKNKFKTTNLDESTILHFLLLYYYIQLCIILFYEWTLEGENKRKKHKKKVKKNKSNKIHTKFFF